ncbi:hypothetical protein C2E19_23320 [Pseudomonas sp. DTU12.3]|uniref:hypothetical protein n=1 Tax=Pseudomonas sp. DTU12.3 TaxID=2073078 RepID=UPI001012F967|nr:hypothetical protein [Pseudomonas sp. DTU12.3]QAX86593.1 hypothetical protein C2E19_23320 [Pseudomonas sp. DTU12.3]
MKDSVENDETGRDGLDFEDVQISTAQLTEQADGSLRELGEGKQFSELFWSDAITTRLHQTHPRVSELKTELVLQYKFEGGQIKVRTLRYKMTTRGANKDRANIDIALSAAAYVRRNSPDSMLQDAQWHNYEIYLESSLAAPSFNMYLVIRVNYDGANNDVGDHEGWGVHIRPAQKPLIQTPLPGSVQTMPFAVSGKNGLLNGRIHLSCSYNGNAHSLGSVNARADGTWNTSISLPSGVTSFYAEQVIGSENSGRSDPVSIKWYVAPRIDSPANNAVVAAGSPLLLKGQGISGETIEVFTPDGGQLHATAVVGPNGTWEAPFDQGNYPRGGLVWMTAGHINRYDWSVEQFFKLLGAPPLTSHSDNQQVERQIAVGGTLADPFKAGRVSVYRDSTNTLLGGGDVAASGSWSAAITLNPGPDTVTASHVYSSVPSVRSVPVRLLVRPPQPTLKSELVGGRVRLSGTGYNGTGVRMDIHLDGNVASPYLDAVVSAGAWSKEIPQELLPGTYRFSGRQSVSDGGSGRIYSSSWASEIRVNIPTPIPLSVTVSVNGQRATFRGRGNQWGTNAVDVTIFNNGVVLANVPKAEVQTNLNWETSATADLAPGNYTQLTARQGANQQWSADSAVFSMTVACPAPSFSEPATDTPSGQCPRISGMAWPGSQVILKIPGKPDVPLTANGGIFERNAAEEWAPATYTITATATFGGQTSLVERRTFTVGTPKPFISTPANAEVDLSPIIEGTGYPGCWVVIFSNVTHQSIGAGPVDGESKWRVTLNDQSPSSLTFYAVQQESRTSDNRSQATAVRTVRVRVPKPLITVPAQSGRPARESLFSGTGQYPGTVELSIKGQTAPFLKDINVRDDGTWEVQVTLTAGGPRALEARQRQRGYASDPFERVVTVVPAIPSVDTPRAGENLGRELRISGFGFAGDTTLIYRRGSVSSTLRQTLVLADGTWSATVAHNLLATDGINVSASAGQGLDSALSPVVTYTLLGTRPSLTEPLSGDWVGVRPLFCGLATPGATITVASWSNADDVLAPAAIADTDGRWSVVGNKDLPEGPMRVVVSQNFNGVRSEGFESARFIVERKTAGFEAPSVNYPLAGQSVGRYPMFSGSGEPGAEVLIVKEGSVATELGRTRVGRDGRWALRAQIQLPVSAALYFYSVRQSRDGAISAWLLPHRSLVVTQVEAGFEKPLIDEPYDDANQILEGQPLFAGRGVPGADLYIAYEGEVTLLAVTQVNAEGKWSVRGRISLPPREAPYRISAQQSMDGQVSQSSSTISFKVDDRLALFVVSSPQRGAEVSSYAVFHGTGLPGGEVRLYRWADPARIRGQGIVDSKGHWVIVTDALSAGRFVIGGYICKGTVVSPSLPEFELNVINGD